MRDSRPAGDPSQADDRDDGADASGGEQHDEPGRSPASDAPKAASDEPQRDAAAGLQQARMRLRSAVRQYFEEPVTGVLLRLGVPAAAVTLFGLALSAVAAYVAANGWFVAAGLISIPAALSDMFDGAIARARGNAGDRGALLDSTLDRLSEAVLLLGLAVYWLSDDGRHDLGVVLCFVALTGSIMVSYIRARAEGLGYRGTSGFLTRPERIVVLTLALLISQPLIGIWILAIGTPISAGYRFLVEWRNADSGGN